MNPTAFLIGDNIYLRPLVKQDAKGPYLSWFNNADVCFGNSHYKYPQTETSIELYIEGLMQNKSQLTLAIVDINSDKHIGNVSLQGINFINHSAEFAIIIGDIEFWGKGVGKEAASLIINHGFNELNLHRIHLGTYENNIGMRKIAESLGFVQEGIRREADFKAGRYLDVYEYGLLKREFLSLR